jgi:dihydrofolate reductase
MSIYFYGCITIDGYLADKNHDIQWLNDSGAMESGRYEDFYSKIDITIMGKNTFNEINKFDDPGKFYPTSKNYVFTHSKNLSVRGFEFISEDIISFIHGMDSNLNIWIIGGNTILSPLLDNNLVDVCILQVAPVLLGKGISLFTQKENTKRFHLLDVKKYNQFAELTYVKFDSLKNVETNKE